MFKKVISFIWQLPQNIIGFLISRFSLRTYEAKIDGKKIKVYLMKYFFNSGVSLGNYIILQRPFANNLEKESFKNTIKHEYGHTKQSLIFGPFYLIVVGIPSIVRNIHDRLHHKWWPMLKRCKWYYGHYPENWADKFGKVHRF